MEHISGGARRDVTGTLVKNSDVYQVRFILYIINFNLTNSGNI